MAVTNGVTCDKSRQPIPEKQIIRNESGVAISSKFRVTLHAGDEQNELHLTRDAFEALKAWMNKPFRKPRKSKKVDDALVDEVPVESPL